MLQAINKVIVKKNFKYYSLKFEHDIVAKYKTKLSFINLRNFTLITDYALETSFNNLIQIFLQGRTKNNNVFTCSLKSLLSIIVQIKRLFENKTIKLYSC